nr:MAG TPA: ssDNA binding protein [Caudoviricetes sp.]
MTIVKTSKELTKKEAYKMTLDAGIKKMKDYIGASIDVYAYCVYTDFNSKDNKEVEVLSIMGTDGSVYATNSATFKRDFMNIATLMEGEDFSIGITSGTSKAGRDFIACTLI